MTGLNPHPQPDITMNTRLILRLIALSLTVAPGARVLADVPSASETINFRSMTLDMIEKNARETSEREDLRANRKRTAQVSPLSAANFDLNKDGKLDEKEFAAWSAAVRAAVTKSPEAMKRFDTNKDGKLSDAEWAIASEQLFGPAK